MPRIFLAVVIAVAGGAVACGGTEPAAPAGEPASAVPAEAGAGSILRVDPSVDALIPTDARIEKLADGFVFIEGPVWLRGESRLLFSDVRGNTIYQWTEADGASPFIDPVFEGDATAGGRVWHLRGRRTDGLLRSPRHRSAEGGRDRGRVGRRGRDWLHRRSNREDQGLSCGGHRRYG